MAQQPAAPPFEVSDIEGNRYSSEALAGKVVVLNFWFVQCRPCVMEMPELNELVKKYQEKDVVFLAFATNGEEELERFLQKKDFDYQLIPSSLATAEAYAVEGYPTHVVINQQGQVTYRTMGLSSSTVEEVDQHIGQLLAAH